MSRQCVRASSQYLDHAGSPTAVAVAIALGAWVKISSLPGGEMPVVSIRTSGSGNHRYTLSISAAGNVQWTARTTTSSSATSASALTVDGLWHFILGEEVSTTSRFASLDGTRGTENTTSRSPSGMNLTEVGRANVGTTQYFDGLIAVPFAYLGTLDGTQRANLAAMSPDDALTFDAADAFWPFSSNADPEVDAAGAFDLAVNGATWSSDEPSFGGGVIVARNNLMLLGMGR